MEADQLLIWKSLIKALTCLLGPKFQTPRIVKRREQLAAVEEEVATLHGEMQGSGPGSGERSDTIAAKNLRVALRKQHINSMNADGLLYLDGVPGIEDTLRLPPTRVSDQKLVDAAKRIIDGVRPYRDTFIEHDWTPDFIARAERAVEALEKNMKHPGANANRASRARASLPAALRKGRKLIKAITRLVQDELANDVGAQRMWMLAKRIPKTMGRPKYPQRSKRIYPPPDATDGSSPPETWNLESSEQVAAGRSDVLM
jgi:hypothetical protein